MTSPSGTRRFLYDGDKLISEYDASGTILGNYTHGSGPDEPLLSWEAANNYATRYFHADHQGSVVAAADDAGNLTSINAYDPWGVPNASNVGRFGYTGQAWLPELGMWYYKARIYSPTLGRFLQTDPIGYKDQVNLYAYVGNDPVDNRDPEGKQAAAAGSLLCTGPQALACGAVVAGVACAASQGCRDAVAGALNAIGDGVRNLFGGHRQADQGRRSTAGAESRSESRRKQGPTVYRLSGGISGPRGHSWTTVDPRSLSSPRDALGLPNGNTATTLSIGRLTNTEGVIGRRALPLDGNKGGAPELLVPSPSTQISGVVDQPFREPRGPR